MDETIDTHVSEVKEAPAGSVEAEVGKEMPKKPDTVPLAVYLELKEDMKSLKHEIKSAKEKEKETVAVRGVADIHEKYPDVSKDFINDILVSATLSAKNEIEAKYNPILEKQELEKKQIAFDRAFDKLFDGAVQESGISGVDKELVKEIAVTPKYRNTPVAEIIKKIYGEQPGRGSSENDVRAKVEDVTTISDFGKMNNEQKRAVLEDPKARQKYFEWLDANGK